MFYYERLAKDNSNKELIKLFLEKQEISVYPLCEGNVEGVNRAISSIEGVNLDKMIEVSLTMDYEKELKPSDVPQYSTLENSLQRTLELLEFSETGMTFYDIGYDLMKPDERGAAIKYGENHAKLAESCNIVSIDKRRKPAITKNTSLGSVLAYKKFEEKKDLYKKLLLREYALRKIIYYSSKGDIEYRKCVPCLAESTAIRRRSNVKELLEFILDGSKYELLVKRIKW